MRAWLASLCAALSLWGAAPAVAQSFDAAAQMPPYASPAPTIKLDSAGYTAGAYLIYASPWCALYHAPTLLAGRDYRDSIQFVPTSFPAGVQINWQHPSTASVPSSCGVYGYMELTYGNYDGGIPAVAVTPKQVNAVASFTETFSASYSAPAQGFDILTELWLTDGANSATHLFEIGWYLHTPKATSTFVNGNAQLGAFTDSSGRVWQVSKSSAAVPFITFTPLDRRDDLADTLDWKPALLWLQARGVITGAEWVRGVAYGVEPQGGSGSLVVNSFSAALN